MAQNNYVTKFQSNRNIPNQVFQNINIRPDILKYLAGSFKTPRRGKKKITPSRITKTAGQVFETSSQMF